MRLVIQEMPQSTNKRGRPRKDSKELRVPHKRRAGLSFDELVAYDMRFVARIKRVFKDDPARQLELIEQYSDPSMRRELDNAVFYLLCFSSFLTINDYLRRYASRLVDKVTLDELTRLKIDMMGYELVE